jgi:phosphoribosylformylglycinamidine cyclo-ligase
MKRRLTYRGAGVDINEGKKLVGLIRPMAGKTRRKGVIGGIGGFGSFFSARFEGLKDPVLVSSTDGVGTKLKVAFMADRHDTVGIDLVAMCVNDIVVSGAEPLFFLDYMACGSLVAGKAATVIQGIAKGCKQAGCALAGGETAEMPGFYKPGEYDLAGFAVGVVDRKRLIDGSLTRPGDILIGLKSNGLHSNGFSLARKVLFKKLGMGLNDRPKGLRKTIGSELLTPTRIYVRPVLKVVRRFDVRAMAHITGGGFEENIPRVLPRGLKAVIFKNAWPVPPIFKYIQSEGNVDQKQMLGTFNCGIGFIMVVRRNDGGRVIKTLEAAGEKAYHIGEIKRKGRGPQVEFKDFSL